jgi:hypothetical protein
MRQKMGGIIQLSCSCVEALGYKLFQTLSRNLISLKKGDRNKGSSSKAKLVNKDEG